jgi:hypothetical protein
MPEIIESLPKLTHAQRREVCRQILLLEAEQDDIAACEAAAVESFSRLEKMEAEDARGPRREER